MIRVSRRRPCPICDRPDWCLVADDGSAAICARVESDKPAGNKGAGWVHRLRDDFNLPPRQYEKPKPIRKRQIDWDARSKKYQRQLNDNGCQYLADQLGISPATLRLLDVGWCPSRSCWTWPMRDAAGRIVGMRTRHTNGSKKADAGGDGNGLFLGPDLASDYLLVCEGPTDTAALIDCGYTSVLGRPSCRGGNRYTIEIIRRLSPAAVVLIPDRDDAGLSGFADLAAAIAESGAMPVERIDAVTPPPSVNDAREWAQKNRKHLCRTIAARIEIIKQRSGGSSNDAE